MNNFRLRTLLALLASLWLSACSTLTPKIPSQFDHWQVRGKLSVINATDSNSGYLTWQQQQDNYDIYIAGPFGAGGSRLTGNKHQASLLLAGWKQAQQSRTPERLMQDYLGWSFPLQDIRYWVKGQSAPGSQAQAQYNEQGQLTALNQHGWEIKFSRYQQYQGQWLPSLIKMTGHDYRLTLAVKEWFFYDN